MRECRVIHDLSAFPEYRELKIEVERLHECLKERDKLCRKLEAEIDRLKKTSGEA